MLRTLLTTRVCDNRSDLAINGLDMLNSTCEENGSAMVSNVKYLVHLFADLLVALAQCIRYVP